MASPAGILQYLRRKIGGAIFFARRVEEDDEALYGPNPNGHPPTREDPENGPWRRATAGAVVEVRNAARNSARTSDDETRKAWRRVPRPASRRQGTHIIPAAGLDTTATTASDRSQGPADPPGRRLALMMAEPDQLAGNPAVPQVSSITRLTCVKPGRDACGVFQW